ncbi:hypothetical protein HY68_37685 [Streptomyces sp. AcH 505]|uniref:molybdenum cofactor biosynthesis F family protein n=1 Tax=Streptomyces sp. AcH 505 TaxID=352211 RepID=UPI0005924240|nr:hypothetical protein HY68_37685 [Streptomyces sp. AcH 505]
MTVTSEATNWISVGELAQSFAPDSNILTRSDDLAGRTLALHLGDGSTISYMFTSGTQLTSITRAHGVTSESTESYLATCLRDGIYFVDYVKAGARPPASVSLVLDLARGVATSVTATLPAQDKAHASILRRAQQKQELTPVNADIIHATIDQPFDSKQEHHLTRELIGLRLQHRYNPHEVYEHIYLNENRYTWHCLSGIEQGLADVDRCHYYKIAPKLYLFIWREKIVPTLGAIMIDLDQMKTTGKIFGYANDALSTASNFQVGAHSKLVNTTVHTF